MTVFDIIFGIFVIVAFGWVLIKAFMFCDTPGVPFWMFVLVGVFAFSLPKLTSVLPI